MASFRKIKPETIAFNGELEPLDTGDVGLYTSDPTAIDIARQGTWNIHLDSTGQISCTGTAQEFTATFSSTTPGDYSTDFINFEVIQTAGATAYFLWFDTTGAESAPAGTGTGIETAINGLSAVADMADALVAAINTYADANDVPVVASAAAGVVTIRNLTVGDCATPTTTDGTNLAVSETTAGATSAYKIDTCVGDLQLYAATGNVMLEQDPTLALGAATKQYVDTKVSQATAGLDPKESVRCATTTDPVALGTGGAYNTTGGTSGRGQITWTSGPTAIDGVTLANGDRILIKDPDPDDQNGIWVRTDADTWDRATDFDEDAEVTANAYCFVEEGTTNADRGYVLVTNDPITIGGGSGTPLQWSVFSSQSSVTGPGSSLANEIATYADTSGSTLSEASQVTVLSGTMTFVDTDDANLITSSDAGSTTALTIGADSKNYIILNDSTEQVELAQDTNLTGGNDLIFTGATTESKILFTDNLETSLSMGTTGDNYIEFDSGDGTEEIRITKNTKINGGSDLEFIGTTGQSEIVFTDNLADGLSVTAGGTDYMTFTSTDSAEKIEFGVPICFRRTITTVGDANHTMLANDCIINYNTALTADRTITLVDPTTVAGLTVRIIRATTTDANDLIVDPGAFEIDGSTTDIKLKRHDDHLILTSNGSNWYVM